MICFLFLCLSLVMDPLSRLNVMHLQDPLPKPLDLTKQISKALDLVKKPSRSDCASGTDSIRSPRSEFGYESVCVPLNTLLPNGITHKPVKTLITTTGNNQTDDVTVKETTWSRTGGEKRERNGAGLQDAPSSQSHSRVLLPAVEILSSESSESGQAECISCDDSSVIKVSPSVPTNNGALRIRRVTENEKREKERTENASPILIESDVLEDSDSLESRNVLSTSEAESADFFKPTQNRSGSSSSSLSSSSSSSLSQKRAPSTKKNRNQQCMRSSAGKKATASPAKRRKKKRSGLSSLSSAFPSHEPEIKLKYASCKEEKREGRGNTFAPHVRMEFSACTVINFEEDSDVQVRKPSVSTGIVPTTSCLQLGRLRSEVRHQTCELCCLCGWTANAAGLGDLHGPYRPCGPDRTTSTDVLINGHEGSSTKRKQTSDEVGERWVHEDCIIWSVGVFLIKGRLYGLDEVVRLAQKAVSSCSVAFFIFYF